MAEPRHAIPRETRDQWEIERGIQGAQEQSLNGGISLWNVARKEVEEMISTGISSQPTNNGGSE